jgi:hypothetical protein
VFASREVTASVSSLSMRHVIHTGPMGEMREAFFMMDLQYSNHIQKSRRTT